MSVMAEEVPHTDDVFVGGRWQSARGDDRTVVSPVTGAEVRTVRLASAEDASDAVAAAHEAQAQWASAPAVDRVAACERWLAEVDAQEPELSRLWAIEAGFPIRHGRALHRYAAVPAWRAALDGAAEVLADDERESPLGPVIMTHEPVGVVLAILPYNGPVVTIASKVIPALLAGCPVVIKAARETHLTMAVVADCARRAGFPPGVISVITSETEVTRRITRDPRVSHVSLTGGHRAGQDVISATAPRYARTHLELGGKSAGIILDDASLDAVMRILVPAATNGAGQVCALLSRVLVPERRRDEILDRMVAEWSRLRLGDPLDPSTQIGPLVNEAAFERTRAAVDTAVADGGTVVSGGGRPEGFESGWYFSPTIVAGVAESASIVGTEVFGPVTVVQTFTDVDDAVRQANATEFGLSGAVFTTDTAAGIDIARRIEAGSVAVNAFGPVTSEPFGGVKSSGWGRESGADAILGFTELKQILVGAA
ncbi:aldehyde dehydrogenase family protein [Brevibacterium sp. VCM10]|uniref:aldehyde dehydrogenase family protein n=1 Tax=Brevibacterium sp. VCM10 TaxID=1381751 RepID=UPI0006860C1C|nr:aldehyde dehydrogenase family protein [Brevibacterium sp. VCM10]